MTDPKHKGLYAALAAAQAEMGRALKDTNNPHFKSKYADLASVMGACMPALTKHGIAVLQPAYDDETGRYIKTIFVHGESGESTECRVPLIVQKNDMQGYGSASTYARRYGLMGMAGIAPEDDDGNAAAKNPPGANNPKPAKAPEPPKPAEPPAEKNPDAVRDGLLKVINAATGDDDLNMKITGQRFEAAWQWLAEGHENHSHAVRKAIDDKRAALASNADLGGDEIPDFGTDGKK